MVERRLTLDYLLIPMVALLMLSRADAVWGETPAIWLAPNYGVHTSSNEVFTPDDFYTIGNFSHWAVTASHASVFKIYAAFFKDATDEHIQLVITALRRANLQLAIEFGALTPGTSCGVGVEGYDRVESIRLVSRRVKTAGGTISYVAMDEPFWFAHRSNVPNACHLTIAEIAENVSANMRIFQEEFPAIKIGDIEPITATPDGHLADELAEWFLQFEHHFGVPLTFLHADILWTTTWRQTFAQTATLLREQHVRIGIIVSGDNQLASGDEWADDMRNKETLIESDKSVMIDDIVFQSWSRFPIRVFDEQDPLSLMGLVRHYIQMQQ